VAIVTSAGALRRAVLGSARLIGSGLAASALLAGCGGGGSAPAASVPAVQPPLITGQPAGASVLPGQTANFSVTATGTGPLTYQWRRAGTAIAGAAATIYTTPPTVLTDSGASFDVVVSNAGGSVTSNAAVLMVTAAPSSLAFSQQPANLSVVTGASAQFTVAATCDGTALAVFQWQRSNDAGASFADVGGATSAALMLTTALSDDQARFRVAAVCGGVTGYSTAATLTVTAPVAASPAICSGSNGRGWCWVHPQPQGSLLASLLVDNTTQAIAVGRTGTVVRTSDAGLTWSGVVPLPTFGADVRDISDIARVDSNRLVAVGGNLAMTSADNGATWTSAGVVLPVGIQLQGVVFTGLAVRGNVALATALHAGGGLLLRSANGGLSWTTVAQPDRALYSVTFVSDSSAVAVGELTRVMRSADAGQTWTDSRLDLSSSSNLRRVRMTDATVGLIGADNGIYRTSDAGATWTLVTTPFVNSFFGIDARASTGVALAAGGNGALFRSADGGQTWIKLGAVPPSFILFDVRFFSDTVAVAVGSAGQVLRSTDAGVTWTVTSASTRFSNELDTFAADVHFGGPNVGLLVGQSGVIRSTDGGRNWSNVATFDGLLLAGVAFVDATTAVVLQQVLPTTAADNYDLLRSTDGGLSFTGVARMPAYSVRFNSAGVGLAVGLGGGVWRSADRGQTWTSVRPSSFLEFPLSQVRWAGDAVAVAVSSAQLLRSTDAGLTWAPASLPANAVVSAVAFRSSAAGLAVGTIGSVRTLFSTNDGGATWTGQAWSTLVGPDPVAPSAIAYADAQTVVAIGASANMLAHSTAATLLRSTDAGATWSREPVGQWGHLTALHFMSATEGVVAGDGFGILRTTTGGAR
jgi:photosystem II stability/assembly factor-like uncharacterized protein